MPLEVMQFRQGSSGRSKQPYIKTAAHTVVAQKEGKIKCQICAQPHSIYQCETFMKASVGERQLIAKKIKCWNCLRIGHTRSVCFLDKVCKICGYKHHTLLHNVTAKQQVSEDTGSTLKTTFNTETVSATIITDTNGAIVAHGMPRSPALPSVLLSTALVRVHRFNGRTELCRALLDSTSQSHFISNSLVTRLGLRRVHFPVTVECISDASTKMSEMTSLFVSSHTSDTSYTLNAIVTPWVTVDYPLRNAVLVNPDSL